MFSVRIVSVDHYMNPPIRDLDVCYSDFRGSEVKQVPVVRIFGITPTGEKACVHVHGVFPYICIPYDGLEHHSKLSYQIAASLDKALNIALGNSNATTQHVYKVVLVSGIPFYGYHKKKHQFLKIYFYKPSSVKQAVNLLQNGAILSKIFQPHEAHVSFILQFFIDFNLYGMSFIQFSEVQFRRNDSPDVLSKYPGAVFLPESVKCQSVCQLEVDVSAAHILNRSAVPGDGQMVNPGIAAIWADERRRRAVAPGTPLLTPQLHSQRPDLKPSSSDMFYRMRLKATLDAAVDSADDSSLSGEPNKNNSVYPREAPPNSHNLDASFISLHKSPPISVHNARTPVRTEDPDDTIVDEDLILNLSLTQRHLSQNLDKSVALDNEDLEILDVLENLADVEPTMIDDNSVLGSQRSQNRRGRCFSGNSEEENANSDDDDEEERKWLDVTIPAQEDENEIRSLLDLTMPEYDENVLNNPEEHHSEPQAGPSGYKNSNFRIPQLDGADDIPSKPSRKSLGMCGVRNRRASSHRGGNNHLMKSKYEKMVDEVVLVRICEPEDAEDSKLNQVQPFENLNREAVDSDQIDKQPLMLCNGEFCNGEFCNGENSHGMQTSHQESGCVFSQSDLSGSTAQDVLDMICSSGMAEQQFTEPGDIVPDFSKSSIQNTLDSHILSGTLETDITIQNTLDMDLMPDTQSLDSAMNFQLHLPVACCSSTMVNCELGVGDELNIPQICSEDFNDSLSSKEGSVLRGDPSLYTQPASENDVYPEDWIADLQDYAAQELQKVNSGCAAAAIAVPIEPPTPTEPPSSSSKEDSNARRSTRIAARQLRKRLSQSMSESLLSREDFVENKKVEDNTDTTANLSPCSCDDITDLSGFPGLSASAFCQLRESLGSYPSSADTSTADDEMVRLSGALQKGHMEEILRSDTQTGPMAASPSRRAELLCVLEAQRQQVLSYSTKSTNDCKGTCSKRRSRLSLSQDPVEDELLCRGRGRSPAPGTPAVIVSNGKNMELAKRALSASRNINVSRGKDMDIAARHSGHLKGVRRSAHCSSPLLSRSKNSMGSPPQNVPLPTRGKRRSIVDSDPHDVSLQGKKRNSGSIASLNVPHAGRRRTWSSASSYNGSVDFAPSKATRKQEKAAIRNERRLKLSLTAQQKRKKEIEERSLSSRATLMGDIMNCHVVLERITKKNISEILRKFKVKLKNRKPLEMGLKSRHSRIKLEKVMVPEKVSVDNMFNSSSKAKRPDPGKGDDSGVETTGECSSTHSVIYEELCIKSETNSSMLHKTGNKIYDKENVRSTSKTRLSHLDESKGNEESCFLLSLSTSDIQLNLSSDSDIVGKSIANTGANYSTCEVLKQTKNVFKPIPCLDGAHVESSSSSSGNQSTHSPSEMEKEREDLSLGHSPTSSLKSSTSLKRKKTDCSASDSSKGSHKSECLALADLPQGSKDAIPRRVADWFANQYLPWCFWSPNTSPSHRPSHMFSPPRPVSPDGAPACKNTTCRPQQMPSRDFAAVSHSCISSSCPPAINVDSEEEPRYSHSSQQNMTHRVMASTSSSTSVEVTNDFRTCRKELLFSEPVLEVEDSYSGKASQNQSILDMFSDRSNSTEHQFSDSNEEKDSNCNPSDVSTVCGKSTQDSESNDCSTLWHSEKGAEAFSLLGSSDSHPLVSVTNQQRNSGATCSSSDSSGFQCGQQKNPVICNQDKSYQPNCHKKVSGTNEFTPLMKPPSREEVFDSLTSYDIPEALNQEPFYGHYTDVSGRVEVGGRVLELPNYNCIHLEEFRSNIAEVSGLRQQQGRRFVQTWGLSQVKGDVEKLIMSHAGSREVVISPVIKPPSVRDVCLWDKARKILRQEKNQVVVKDTAKHSTPSRPCVQNQELEHSESPVSITGGEPLGHEPKASTPLIVKSSDVSCQDLPSPVLVPTSLEKSGFKVRAKKSRRFLGKLLDNSKADTSLPPISETVEGDNLILSELDDDTPVTNLNAKTNQSQESASLRRLLLDSQFCHQATSPVMRHVSDASACQIEGFNSTFGFKMAVENLQDIKANVEHQFTTVMSMELHIRTCGSLKPDPERDPIRAVFYTIVNDVPEDSSIQKEVTGVIAVDDIDSCSPLLHHLGLSGVIAHVKDEKTLFNSVISLTRLWDPDIFAGYEIEMLSWGYLIQRAYVCGMNMGQELSRVPKQKNIKSLDDVEDSSGLSGICIVGRIVLDVWRLLKSEVALTSYTFENVMFHILHQRLCHYSFETLSRWWEHTSHHYRWITVKYYQQRVMGVTHLLNHLDLIGRTSELARLFGIQFFEVLSRGSQFRVESMMLRMAKPLNYVPVSPSVQQRARMRAPECLPLIMEPESRFYSDPVIVLDFQSLYPSIIIAYNYCFSTCLGRVEHLGKSSQFEFGCTELRVTNAQLKRLRDGITVSPCGVAFVTSSVRQGVLPSMLAEILEARLAVKQSMKKHKDDPTLQRVLHARQLGLKLIANVTYGYTSANFSGRMPCIEIGDSVVGKARETLERAIALVHRNKEWRARVVYGDTDSLFVLVPGRDRQEAFRIGAEIAEAVTQDNPSPIKLKLEKVYQPSILQTKKRYVGYMYESKDQKEPVYEAKGIETVRRDGCPAVAKMLEKSLRLLFESRDISSVKRYVIRQFSKILQGRANIQDLTYAREYRGMASYRPGACVPCLELTRRWLQTDRRSEPRIGERVPYVIINGPPGLALIHLVRHPNELLTDSSLRYNAVYYITRAITPPLQRCFSLLGANVSSWYSELPRKHQLMLPTTMPSGHKKSIISHYFTTLECVCCNRLTHGGVCNQCRLRPQELVTSLMDKLHSWEVTYNDITKICQSCVGSSEHLDCISLDCPLTYRRNQAHRQLEQSAHLRQLLENYIQ